MCARSRPLLRVRHRRSHPAGPRSAQRPADHHRLPERPGRARDRPSIPGDAHAGSALSRGRCLSAALFDGAYLHSGAQHLDHRPVSSHPRQVGEHRGVGSGDESGAHGRTCRVGVSDHGGRQAPPRLPRRQAAGRLRPLGVGRPEGQLRGRRAAGRLRRLPGRPGTRPGRLSEDGDRGPHAARLRLVLGRILAHRCVCG